MVYVICLKIDLKNRRVCILSKTMILIEWINR